MVALFPAKIDLSSTLCTLVEIILFRVQRKSHFYILPFRQAEASILTSPDVISTSPKNFLTSRIDFTVLLLLKFLKKHHLPVGEVKTEFTKCHVNVDAQSLGKF